MPSGVWLANYEALPRKYILNNNIRTLCKKTGATLWFHIEIHKGVLSEAVKDPAGVYSLDAPPIKATKLFTSSC